jgi:hypothetical protein
VVSVWPLGMARQQSAGVMCAVLVEGSATDKELGSLGLLVMSIIHGLKEKTGPLSPPEGPRHHRMPSLPCAGRKETPL